MCGRYELKLTTPMVDDLVKQLQLGSASASLLEQRPDVRPTETVPVVLNVAPHELQLAKWGIGAAKTINARDDKLDSIWRAAAETRRCLIPASAFFEWRSVPDEKRKRKVRFSMRDGRAFLFAGLWARGDGPVTCAIITTSPSSLVAPVHDRMPAILRNDAIDLWRASGRIDIEAARAVLAPYPAEEMMAEDVDAPAAPPAQGSLF